MSQRELALAIGRDNKHISQIERGVFARPRPATLKALARALDISVAWLATGYGDMLGSHPAVVREEAGWRPPSPPSAL